MPRLALAALALCALPAPARGVPLLPGARPPYPPRRGGCTMQVKLQQMAPAPVSVVFLEQPRGDAASMRAVFDQIAREGFSGLKQLVLATPLNETRAAFLAREKAAAHAAFDAGLAPFYFGDVGGWECFTDELLAELALPADAPPWALQAAPAMRAYQAARTRARIDAMILTSYQLGEPGAGNPVLAPALVPAFADWLNGTYLRNLTALQLAWADPFRGNLDAPEFGNVSAAAASLAVDPAGWPSHDYRRYRDSMRFQADALLAKIDAGIDALLALDADAPVRTGGASLQLNAAYYSWDLFAQGALAERAGSFYISSHLPWHYSGFQHEVDRPVFFEVSAAVAAGRGAWPGEWESTGGPSQYSGGQATAVDAGVITKLMLSYVAAGMRGIGLWTYNGRTKGQEMGEYMLTSLQGRPTARSAAAGAIARALDAWRWELWADDGGAPVVGIFYGWENEAVSARLGLQAPPFECATQPDADCRFFSSRELTAPVLARLGWARALVDAHVPFTHVSEEDVRGARLGALGLRTLVLPHVLGLPPDLLPAIRAWQLAGGRVVADMPWLLLDAPGGELHDQAASAAADIFGAYVAEFASVETPADGQAMAAHLAGAAAAPTRVPRGQYARLELTHATVALAFDAPHAATPALLEARAGAGSAALVNFEAGRLHAAPAGLAVAPAAGPLVDVGATLALSAWMAAVATDGGALAPAWAASPLGVPVFLRSAVFNGSSVRHWFALYDDVVAAGTAGAGGVNVTIDAPWATASARDAVTGADVPVGGNASHTRLFLHVPWRSGVWVRSVDA